MADDLVFRTVYPQDVDQTMRVKRDLSPLPRVPSKSIDGGTHVHLHATRRAVTAPVPIVKRHRWRVTDVRHTDRSSRYERSTRRQIVALRTVDTPTDRRAP